jgi:hypothetical protein
MAQLQVALVYLLAGWLKLNGEQWQQGTALHYVLQLDTMLMPPAFWLRDSGLVSIFPLLTQGVVWLELLWWALVFAPFLQPLLRLLGLMGGLLLHGGIALLLAIPDFPLLMPLTYVLFCESRWIVTVENRIRQWRGLPLLIPEPVPSRVPLRWRQVGVSVIQALLMLGVIWWNADTSREYGVPLIEPMPAPLRTVIHYTGLWQYWDLFAPLPLQIDGWIIIPARFEDGTQLDLKTGAPLTTTPPAVRWGPTLRWRKFEYNVNDQAYVPILRAWGRSYCRWYNESEARPVGQRLATLEIRFHYRRSVTVGEPPRLYDENLLWVHWCYDEYRYEAPSG